MYQALAVSLIGEYFEDMANTTPVAARLDHLRKQQDRSVLWLHRQTGLPYKSLLNQIKGRRPLTLEYASVIAPALNVELQDVVAP